MRVLRRKNYIRSLAAVAFLIMILNINRARNSYQFLIETNVKESVDEVKKMSPFLLNAPPNTDAKELHLYLHVGPGKMATTTIQNSLKEDTALLNEDGYCVFDPVTMHTHIGHLLRKQNSTFIIGDPKWNEFLSFLDQCHSLRQNVLVSSEGLGLLKSAVWNEVMKQAFSRWTFHIVVGYRRYYEWVPSLYYQIYRKTIRADSIQSNIPPINEFVSNDYRPLKLWTYRYLQHWKKLVGNDLKFSIYNMHEDRNILKTFYCKMLNDTKTACSKHNNDTAKSLNKRYSLEYHRLVIEANNHYELLPDGTDLNKAATELETIHRREMGMNTRKFPRICLDDDKFSKLLNVSLEMEEKLLPDWFSSENGEADIQRKFKTFADRELCSVDIIKIFKGEQYSNMWTAWLDHLGVEI